MFSRLRRWMRESNPDFILNASILMCAFSLGLISFMWWILYRSHP